VFGREWLFYDDDSTAQMQGYRKERLEARAVKGKTGKLHGVRETANYGRSPRRGQIRTWSSFSGHEAGLDYSL
jgi:hypothetical protein